MLHWMFGGTNAKAIIDKFTKAMTETAQLGENTVSAPHVVD